MPMFFIIVGQESFTQHGRHHCLSDNHGHDATNNCWEELQVPIKPAQTNTGTQVRGGEHQSSRHPWYEVWSPHPILDRLPLQVGSLEEENQELFNTATTSEEELDAVNGRLYAATNSLATAELRVHELEQRLQEALAAAPQHSEVPFFPTIPNHRAQKYVHKLELHLQEVLAAAPRYPECVLLSYENLDLICAPSYNRSPASSNNLWFPG